MQKSTKGALAAVAGGVLLLGGAGSLAYWTDAANVAGGTLTAGRLSLTDTTTNGCASSPWKIDSGEQAPGITFDPGTDKLVPGDVITKHCTYTINAEGTHLRATLAASGAAATGELAPALTAAGSFTVGGSTVTEITEDDGTKTLDAAISVTFKGLSGNATQTRTADLSGFVVTVTQVHS